MKSQKNVRPNNMGCKTLLEISNSNSNGTDSSSNRSHIDKSTSGSEKE